MSQTKRELEDEDDHRGSCARMESIILFFCFSKGELLHECRLSKGESRRIGVLEHVINVCYFSKTY